MRSSFVIMALATLSCAPSPAPVAAPSPAATSAVSAAAVSDAGAASNAEHVAAITTESISAPAQFLASDALEGRGPGARGDRIAIEYVAAEFASYGLAPGGDKGTFYQNVPLIGILAKTPKTVTAHAIGSKDTLTLAVPNDLMIMSGVQAATVDLKSAPLVFVGYGIVAPEYQWDDYKDADVRGKVVIVMNNDPSSDAALFAGTTRLWYGRWDYKYLQAARKGAAGVIVIHTTPSAGYPYQVVVASNAREKFELKDEGEPSVLAKMWATEDASRKLVALGGGDLDSLRKAAESRDFHPTELKASLGAAWTNVLRSLETTNVIGVIPGSEAALASEAVLYSAHHDHYGIGTPKNGDAIYNGAVDNAAGVGVLLGIARAASLSSPTRRSQVFCAVAAEEPGLLGSAWYARHPTFAPGRIAADLNIDMPNVYGPTTDVGFIGMGKSPDLDAVVRDVAQSQGRAVHGDSFPDRGMYYRSDQFSFAKVGVPGIYLIGGPNFVGRPAGWGEAQKAEYDRTKYHQPSDEYDPSWDWRGALQDAELIFLAGRRIATMDGLPRWKPDDEFAHIALPR